MPTPAPQTDALTVNDMDNLRHMLGVDKRTPRGYRNYFVAGECDVPSMERYQLSDAPCYHATETGARFIGLERLPR
jgi:hypothetical protein